MWGQGLVDGGDGLFIFQVLGIADAAHDKLCPNWWQRSTVMPLKAMASTRLFGKTVLDLLQALLGAEHIVLVGVDSHGHIHFVKECQSASHNRLMS